SKRGSPYLRRAVWMASMIAVQRDPMFKAYYEKKASEGLRYMNIIGHVTKKMTAVIYAIMRDNKAYIPVMPVVA
uniref:transposase n=1 Tax=Dysosmobacter welbionis TaxID=2093857 RepID=UPI003FEE882B